MCIGPHCSHSSLSELANCPFNIIQTCYKKTIDYDIPIDKQVIFHSCNFNYLANPDQFEKYSRDSILKELKAASMFKNSAVVIHPGTRKFNGVLRSSYETLDVVVESCKQLCAYEFSAKILLENCAEKTKVPRTIDDMIYLYKKLEENNLLDRVNFCIDTCHLFSAGEFDLSTKKHVDLFYEIFCSQIGLEYLFLIHLNDSKKEFGSGVDRHENLGEGHIWKDNESLERFLKLFGSINMICEVSDFELCMLKVKNCLKYKRIECEEELVKCYNKGYFGVSIYRKNVTPKIEELLQKFIFVTIK